MIVDPPSHRLPGDAFGQAVHQPRNYDCCHCTHAAVVTALVPDVPGTIALVRSAVLEVRIPERIHLRRSVRRPNRQTAERSLKRFKQIFAECPAGNDGKIRIVGHVVHAISRRDLAVEKSRMKKDSDSRVRVKASVPRTVTGFLILNEHTQLHAVRQVALN